MLTLHLSSRSLLLCAGIALTPCLASAQDYNDVDSVQPQHQQQPRGSYERKVLVSDGSIPAPFTDANLVNAWGVAFNPQAVAWVADNHSGKSTLYDGTGKPQSLVVTIPAATGETLGSPTGIVFSGGMDFVVTGQASMGPVSGPARFIFVAESGQISGWAPTVNPTLAVLAVDNSNGGGEGHAIYKGVALGGNGTTHLLYATDFHNARVDVFDGTFKPVPLAEGAFSDTHIPKGYAPFGIQAINGDIYVTYAKQDEEAEDDVRGEGFGFVDVFDPNGVLEQRLISHGKLNAPWGLAVAPASFGRFGGALLVGNFGDGTINAYEPISGRFLGTLGDAKGEKIVIDGLWGMQFGNGLLAQPTNALFAAAGPNDEEGGTYNVITASKQ